MYARTNINPHPVSDRPCITADNDDKAPNKKPLSEKVTMYAASRSREKATILPRTSAEAMEERLPLPKIPSKMAKFHLQIVENRLEFQSKILPDAGSNSALRRWSLAVGDHAREGTR